MKQWIKQIHYVQQIASHLLQPRKTHYHDDYLRTFFIHQVYKLSKNTHLMHRNFKTPNQFQQILHATLLKHKNIQNDTCLIFLHGYGSNKQEGFTLIDSLPKHFDLCCFDFSASGKSQGTITTYGLKEFRDLSKNLFIPGTIIKKLKEDFSYKRFILWGRSMGAVASFLLSTSQELSDSILKKDIIFQVLDSPFSSFESICAYQGRQSFKLPEPFISYGVEILKSYFKDNQAHLNPFNIDLVKASNQCQISTLFVYSEHDDMIPKQNSLSIIQKLPAQICYEKLLIDENHNTLRSQQTNQEVFKIITKNYLKYLYNIQKSQSFKTKNNEINSLINTDKILNKIQSQLHFSQNGMVSKPYLQTNETLETPSHLSRKQPSSKKEKKYLEIFSTKEKSKKKTIKCKYEMKKMKIDFGQIHSYRNNSSKNTKNLQNGKKIESEIIENEEAYDYKNTMNPINSFKDIHKLRRSNTFDCPEGYEPAEKSGLSTAVKAKDLEEDIKQNNKGKKRALYCSLNKNLIGYKIDLKAITNQSDSQVIAEEQTKDD